MTYADAEIKVARLAAEENCYILMARELENKASELQHLAAKYRERAKQLSEKQHVIWLNAV